MKKNLFKISSIVLLVFAVSFPVTIFAQTSSDAPCDGVTGIGGVLCRLNEFLNNIIPLLITLGVIYFMWGVIRYVIADGEEAKKKGKDGMIYGVLGLAVITSLWGFVDIITKTFGLDNATAPTLEAVTGTSATCSLAGNPKLQDLLCYVTRIINDSVIPLLFTLAVLMFVWGVVQFVINSDEEAKKAKGKQFMIWGVIALAVMLGVWGLVGIVGGTFNLNTRLLPQVSPH